ncbi:MAG TPA: tripartite tricarboxylate transporter TctB family protein [Desulfovibrio sp.]|jgi:hypothetical protein|uniref:tripartite tricarboxylate transporter TctB family protein n=1 Tax=Desulfovibrio TaxID=872 RepID=UPI002A425443|nr:tripartite tricarboxylate transporter TctB family protein [Desulfovibrio sp.]MDY0307733.1 tripartite tricarboxylate transporter TctB family protein [Desulfovibrionaceae bacterium]HMM37998.1 tripartite tricarboxylate transporter TctB family protein [Desulfovibrio sp.]
MRRSFSDIVSGLGFLIVAAAFWFAGRDLTGISRVFPTGLEVFLGLGGLALVFNGIRLARKEAACEKEFIAWNRVVLITAASVIYVLLIPLVGFYVTSVVFLFVLAMILAEKGKGRKGMVQALAFSGGLVGLIWLVFLQILQVPTPSGALF